MSQKINSLQYGSLLVMVLLSSFLGIGIFSVTRYSQVDLVFSVTFSVIIGIVLLILFFMIASYKPELPITQKITSLFGKTWGNIINFVIVCALTIKSIAFMFNLTNFVASQFLSQTPPIIIGLLFTATIIYINFKGIEVISRVALILSSINIILCVTAFFSLFYKVDFSNYMPFLEFGLKRPIIGSLYPLIFNFTPMFFLLMIPKNNVVEPNNFRKYIIMYYTIACIFMIGIVFITLGVLGIDLMAIYQYPEYMVLKSIDIFNFLDRIENIIMIQWLFGLFLSLSYYVYYISNSLNHNNKNKFLIVFVSILTLLLGIFSFKNSTVFNHFVYDVYIYIEAIVTIIFVVIGVIVTIKCFTKKTRI